MKELSIADARMGFSEVLNKVAYGKEIHVLTRRNRPIVALVSLDDLEIIKSHHQDGTNNEFEKGNK